MASRPSWASSPELWMATKPEPIERPRGFRMTFEEFSHQIDHPLYMAYGWRGAWLALKPGRDLRYNPPRLRWVPMWWNVAFHLRFKAGDREGRFGRGYGQWCFPWQWKRLYYHARFPDAPRD